MFFSKKTGGVSWIIAGLGNPGDKYRNTRHNMGFLTVDLLAEREQVKVNRIKFKALTGTLSFGGENVLLMKPQTFMNLSGEAVGEAARFYKIPADHVIILFDDVSLPVGKIRVRPSGSAGGHNGIKSIIAHLGSNAFPRVKIGVGAAEHDMVHHVIGEPSQQEKKVLLDSFSRAIGASECIIQNGCEKAMNQFN